MLTTSQNSISSTCVTTTAPGDPQPRLVPGKNQAQLLTDNELVTFVPRKAILSGDLAQMADALAAPAGADDQRAGGVLPHPDCRRRSRELAVRVALGELEPEDGFDGRSSPWSTRVSAICPVKLLDLARERNH